MPNNHLRIESDCVDPVVSTCKTNVEKILLLSALLIRGVRVSPGDGTLWCCRVPESTDGPWLSQLQNRLLEAPKFIFD